MLCSQACSGAHNLTIAARLASLDALPDNMILAASPGLATRRVKRDRGVFFWFGFLDRIVKNPEAVTPAKAGVHNPLE
jgi:hypothetical protein